MNDFNDKSIEKTIQETAEGIQPNAMFTAELEEKLRKTHKPRKAFTFSMRGFAPVITSAAVLGALTFFMVWLLNTVDLQPTPGNDFACPVTPPNGSPPPGETGESQYFLGNGELWTSLWPEGKVIMEAHNVEADGSLSMKWGFVRGDGVVGPLTIEGRRLDAEAEPLRVFITDGYGDTGFQVTALTFPTTGCWEVTARVGESSLTFVTEVVFGEEMPAPEPTMFITTDETFEYEVQEGDTCAMLADRYGITISELMALNGLQTCEIFVGMKLKLPVTESVLNPPKEGGYDWRGTTLYLEAAIPETPSEVTIYQAQTEIPATVEDARIFAQRFDMAGGIYDVPGELPGTRNYLIVDGNRQLRLRSDGYFTYILDQTAWLNNPIFAKNENAEAVIAEFIQTYGFNGEYKVEYSELFGGYFATSLTPDKFPLLLGYLNADGLLFRFNQNGLLSVTASLLKYDEVLNASVISADEAFQRLLADNGGNGINESTHANSNVEVQIWTRPHPMDEPITYFGWLNSTGPSVDGNAPLITLDGYTVTGNIADIAPNTENVYIEAFGSFHEENGIKSFVMESWKIHDGVEEGIQGRVEREEDQVFITVVEGPKLLLPDFPADIPLPVDNFFILGVTRGDVFEWKTIDSRFQNGGGGGGGGGGGFFYKLNVTGVPVPFPTPDPTNAPTVPLPSEDALQGIQGLLMINKTKHPDGSISTDYGFSVRVTPEQQFGWFTLAGENLSELEAYHNRPIKVWGHAEDPDANGSLVLVVDRYEIPYPDLQFEILTGTQSSLEIDGQNVTMFTSEDGVTYVQLYPIGDPAVDAMIDSTTVTMEVLRIPDETYAGYPALRVFSIGEGSQNVITEITADEPNIYDEFNASPLRSEATIESIELVYYVPDPRYIPADPAAEPLYIQPVWRFTGHYTSGDAFEILIQALTQEFLLPEQENVTTPG